MGDTTDYERLLHAAFDAAEALDPPAMAALYADNATLEFPFAPEGFPPRVEGKSNLVEFFQSFPKYYAKIRFLDRRFTPMADGVTMLAEYRGQWESHKGVPYNNRYIAVIRFEGERVVHMREYFNPQVWTESLAQTRALK